MQKQEKKKILLRGSWQTINIGDIAHTPGFLSLAKDYLPEAEVWLWPNNVDRGVRHEEKAQDRWKRRFLSVCPANHTETTGEKP